MQTNHDWEMERTITLLMKISTYNGLIDECNIPGHTIEFSDMLRNRVKLWGGVFRCGCNPRYIQRVGYSAPMLRN